MKHKCKYGLNSGNTLKFGANVMKVTGSRSPCQNFIVKTIYINEPTHGSCPSTTRQSKHIGKNRAAELYTAKADVDVVPDGDLRPAICGTSRFHETMYTVDKKQRWILPTVIVDCVRNLDEERTSAIENEQIYASLKTRQQRRLHYRNLKLLIEEQRRNIVQVSLRQHIVSGFGRSCDSMDCRPGVLRRAGLSGVIDGARPSASVHNFNYNVSRRSTNSRVSRHNRSSFYAMLRVTRLHHARSGNQTDGTVQHIPRSRRELLGHLDTKSYRGLWRNTLPRAVPLSSASDDQHQQPLALSLRQARSNTRGLQRLHRGDSTRKGKKLNSHEVEKAAVKTVTSADPVSYAPGPDAVHYDVYMRTPLIAHRHFCDTRHFERFQWNYLFHHPQKALKKIASRCRHQTEHRMPTTSVELSQHIRLTRNEHLMDDWPYEESADDNNDSDFTSTSRGSDDVDEYPPISRPSAATLSDFIVRSKSSARRQKRGKLTSDEEGRTMESSSTEGLLLNDSEVLVRCNSSRHQNQKGKTEVSSAFCESAAVPQDDVTGYIENGRSMSPSWFVMTSASTEKAYQKTDNLVDILDESPWSSLFSEQDKLHCYVVERSSIDSLGASLRDRFADSRSIPRRFLVDLSGSVKRRSRHGGTRYNRQRIYLVSEELLPSTVDDNGTDTDNSVLEANSVSLRCHVIGDGVNFFNAELHQAFNDVTVGDFYVIFDYLKKSIENRRDTSGQPPTTSVGAMSTSGLTSTIDIVIHGSHDDSVSCDENTVRPTSVNLIECGICWRTCDEKSRGFSLLECRHWFCVECWHRHLATGIMQNTMEELQCPSHECSNVVDCVTLVSLLPLSLVDQYMTYTGSSSARWRHYSVLRQHRVTVVDGMTTEPRARQISEKQHKKRARIDRNTMSNKVAFLTLNSCPRCGVWIDKSAGCNHMRCTRCGCEFCWSCRGLWGSSCRCSRGAKFSPQLVVLVPSNKDISFNFLDDIKHRSVDKIYLTTCGDDAELTTRLERLNELQRRIDHRSPEWLQTAGTEWTNYVAFEMMPTNTVDAEQPVDDRTPAFVNAAVAFYFNAKFATSLERKLRKMERTRLHFDIHHRRQIHTLQRSIDKVEQLLFQPSYSQHGNAHLLLQLVNALEIGIECLVLLKKRFVRVCF